MSTNILPPLPLLDYCEIRHIPDWPGYAVTDTGEVWSCRNRNQRLHEFSIVWKKRKTPLDRGYITVSLTRKQTKRHLGIHSLMLQAFVGPCPPGFEACHNNGFPTDNRLDNLRWDTTSNNNKDKEKHGTHQTGERHNKAKFMNEDILLIRNMYCNGTTAKDIARQHNVNISTIQRIVALKTWKHV